MGTPSPILDLFLRVSTDHGIGTDPATRAEELLAACDFSTRDRIIVGAISAFLDGGVADTPVEEIARRAGVGKGSVFYTFGSRDRLVEVVLMTLVDVVSARVAGSVPIPWSVETRRNRSRIGDGVPTAGHPILIAGCNDPTV